MLKVVLNNTVHVAALGKGGPGATKVHDAWQEGRFTVVFSEAIWQETADVLRKAGVADSEVQEFEITLRARGILVTPTEKIDVCRDPDDNKFLEAAVAGGAQFIVSDDKDSRILSPFRGIEIITVNEFLRRLSVKKARPHRPKPS